MPEEQTFSDLPYSYEEWLIWDGHGLLALEKISDILFYGLQIGPYDEDEYRAILYS